MAGDAEPATFSGFLIAMPMVAKVDQGWVGEQLMAREHAATSSGERGKGSEE